MKIKGLRWWVVGFVMLGIVTNYLARNTLSVAAADVMKDLGMTTKQYAYVVSTWQICYAFMYAIAGRVVDLLGTKVGLAMFAFVWSLLCMATSWATSWQGLAIFRGLLGATEAAGFPAAIKAITEWFPAKERSVAIGWMNVGAGLGAVIAPPLVVWAIIHGDWKLAFVIVGAVGVVWSISWMLFYKHPSESNRLTDEERQHIVSGQEERFHEDSQEKQAVNEKVAIKKVFTNRNIYAILAARFMTEPAWQTFNAWIPLYLMTQRGMDIKGIALFAWLPFLAADVGSVLGGYLSPFFMRYVDVSLETSRKMVMLFGSLCMIGPACIGLVASPYAAIVLLCVGGFAHQTLSCAIFSITSDSFGKDEVATTTGLGGMSGFLGASIFTMIFGILVTKIGYNPMFVTLACFDIVAAVIIWTVVRPYSKARQTT